MRATSKATRVTKEIPAHRGHKDRRGHGDRKDPPGQQDPEVPQALPARRGRGGRKDRRVLQQ